MPTQRSDRPVYSTEQRLFTDAAGKVRARGSNRQPPQTRYEGRDTRAVRRVQHAIFAIQRTPLTAEQRGGIRGLCNPLSRS